MLDRWLREAALTADRAGTTRVFVWSGEEDGVVAYFELCPHEVRRETRLSKIARGAPNAIPAILLAKLALAETLGGRGLGSQLLADAMSRSVAAVEAAGGRLIVVDAIDSNAATFYAHHDFQVVPENPFRLVMKASDARASMGT